jgi:hypothetical protein
MIRLFILKSVSQQEGIEIHASLERQINPLF